MGKLLFTYGVYFGLVGRDVGMYIIETIFIGPGFTPESKFLLSIRAINNVRLISFLPSVSVRSICGLCSESLNEQPTCTTHAIMFFFHKRCLRRWCMVRKKTTCYTVCRKKADFQLPNRNPWEVPDSFLQWYHIFLQWAVAYSPTLIALMHRIAMIALTEMLFQKVLWNTTLPSVLFFQVQNVHWLISWLNWINKRHDKNIKKLCISIYYWNVDYAQITIEMLF